MGKNIRVLKKEQEEDKEDKRQHKWSMDEHKKSYEKL